MAGGIVYLHNGRLGMFPITFLDSFSFWKIKGWLVAIIVANDDPLHQKLE
jgi:hypothetical protein